MALTSASLPAKRRILTTCIKLFLERGYKKTTVADILTGASVSCSSFQNIFRSKEGVLSELVHYMYANQFSAARGTVAEGLPPVCIYAAETAIQLTLTELNENLREIYIEAYTQQDTLDFIQRSTAKELVRIFGPYQPALTEEDFYALDLGTSGLMRGYMARPCDEELSLEDKLRAFIEASLRVFCVPEAEVQGIVKFVLGLDIRAISQGIMEQLFRQMAMHYEFTLDGILPPQEA